MLLFDLWDTAKEGVKAIDLFGNEAIEMNAIPVLFIASALVALFAIFKFQNRKLQITLGRIVILINLILLGLLVYLLLTLSGEAAVSKKDIGMFLPIVAMLFVLLANKAIQKDEDLVKSVDRLR
tara:strand:- start:17370 stop:17741 length:372 start_codon:yes stop_codon:yes gene_type:complete